MILPSCTTTPSATLTRSKPLSLLIPPDKFEQISGNAVTVIIRNNEKAGTIRIMLINLQDWVNNDFTK